MRQALSIATPALPHTSPNLPAGCLARLGKVRAMHFLASGSAHAHWLIDSVDGEQPRHVWRASASPATTPGASEQAEVSALRSIAGRPWAPRLLAHYPGEGLLFEYIEGEHPEPATLAPAARTALIDVLLECWQTPCAGPPHDYPALVRDYARRAAPGATRDRLVTALLADCARWPATVSRFTHHDLHAGNLLIAADGQWHLLDWEYAGPGNPWFDAAALDIMLVLQPDERQRIETLLGPAPPGHWARMRDWHRRLGQLWALARTDGPHLPTKPHGQCICPPIRRHAPDGPK